MKPCCKETLKVLASGMKKTLSPQLLEKLAEELRWTTNPLGEFLKVLRGE